MTARTRILVGDCRETLPMLPEGMAQCCVTSPPYFGLRDYGVDGQLGLESTPDEYVANLVQVFREVRRVLRDDGTLWLNIGDSYASSTKGSGGIGKGTLNCGPELNAISTVRQMTGTRKLSCGVPDKNLLGIPWRVAFALQADGWVLRSDIVWAKPNPMPESVKDRPTRSHEYLFLLAKSARYFYDADAIKEPGVTPYQHTPQRERNRGGRTDGYTTITSSGGLGCAPSGRNKRDVWLVTPKPYKGAHFAVMPPALVEPCILAGSRPGDTVLDPFGGSGTVGAVATQHGRHAVMCEINPAYATLIEHRLSDARPIRLPRVA